MQEAEPFTRDDRRSAEGADLHVSGKTARPTENWTGVLRQLFAGDRLAFLKINRLITGFLCQLRAYDFRDEWDDLRQEVVAALVITARAGRLRDQHALLAYVRSITRNKFIDRIKRSQRSGERHQLVYEDGDIREASASAGAGSDGNRAGDVWLAVARLPLQHRQVLEGIYRLGKTYEQVATDTGIPLGTVKRRLREALDVLKEWFREDVPG